MAYLLYDSNCSLCAYLAAWVHLRDRRRGRFSIFPLQDPASRALLPQLSDAEYRQSFHLMTNGAVVSGDAAIPAVLERLPGLWRSAGWAMRVLPGGRWLTAVFYRVLAAERERMRYRRSRR